MHSEAPCGPGPRLAFIGRPFARQAETITPHFWLARPRRSRHWTIAEAGLLNPGRAPEESYRDYMFRKAIWY
jgi:hypothetical protein